MGILGVDYDKVNFGDENDFCGNDSDTIIHVRLLACLINLKNAKNLKK